MDDILEGFFKALIKAVLLVVRALYFVVWEIVIEQVLWPIGWCFCRLLTLNQFPTVGIREQDNAPRYISIIVEVIGLLLPLLLFILVGISF